MKITEITHETRTGADLISPETANLMLKAAKWAKFLAIVGFVLIGLMLIALIAGGSMMSGMMPGYGARSGGAVGTIMGIIVLAVYFIPMYFLFQFATRTKKAFIAEDAVTLRDSAASLSQYFTYIGILIVIWLALFLIAIIAAMFGMSA